MAISCRVCGHARQHEIDAALSNDESCEAVAGRFGLPRVSIFNHRGHLVDPGLSAPGEAITGADVLLARMKRLQQSSLVLLAAGENASDLQTLSSTVGLVRKNLEALDELAKRLREELAAVDVRTAPLPAPGD